tara:strand:+ start:66 stop:587 length:522 start_codon:yes stop_codon:yes gene_type:complete
MSDIINKLRELNVNDEDYVTLNYSEGAEVWHINESHVEDAVGETSTASMLAGLLASGVAVADKYNSDGDILVEMRSNGLLDDYERGEEYFQDYLTGKLQETIYDGEYALAYSTEQYDYKRGRCDISTEVRVQAGKLYAADTATAGRFQSFTADSFVRGFDVSVKTPAGTLTLS